MKLSLKFAAAILLAVAVFTPVHPVSAQGTVFDGQVIFGQSFTLKSGETLNGDLLVFGGTANIEEGARVNGNIILFGGILTVDGEVTGDVSVTGGQVALGPAAHIGGDLITVGATLNKAETARVDGQIYNTATSWADGSNVEQPEVPQPETPRPSINFNFNPLGEMFNIFGQAVGMAALAMLLMLFLSPQAGRVAQAVVAQPLTAGGLGLLALIVVPLALILLTITIILIPVVAVLVVVLAVVVVFGWIAVGYEIGQRFTKAIHQDWHPAFSAGLGVFTLTLVSAALTRIPILNCVGWLVPFLLGLAAFGAVLMTRFGTQSVVAPAALVAPEAPLPSVSDQSKGSDMPE